MAETKNYDIPSFVTQYIKSRGYSIPYTIMKPYIQDWGNLYRAEGSFWDYYEKDNSGRSFKVHRRTIMPAKKVCKEWASLLLDEYTQINTNDEKCNEFITEYFERIGFFAYGQELIERSFAQGTGAWALDIDTDKNMFIRRYYVNMVLPLSWDDDGVSEAAFVTEISLKGKRYTQLQMHLLEEDGYHIHTVYFDAHGKEIILEGIEQDFPTGSNDPWFAIVKPAIANTHAEFSPYGCSVFDDAGDILHSVDTAFDAFIGEVDLGKLRVFVNDFMLQKSEDEDGKVTVIPFGKSDATVYRMVNSTDDMVKEFAPTLRTDAQIKAYRTALQMMGDSCGFGLNYFDIDDSGGIKTATEVSSDNSVLMRNIRKHENLLRKSIQQITRAVLQCARSVLEINLPEEETVTVTFDDSIITDTAAEKSQDLAEVGVTMNDWEFRMKWYGEDEETAKLNAPSSNATLQVHEVIEDAE